MTAEYLNFDGCFISAWNVGNADAPPNEKAIVPNALNIDVVEL